MNLKYLYLAMALNFGGTELLMGVIQYAIQQLGLITQPTPTVSYVFMGLLLLINLLAVIFSILSRDNQEARVLSTVAVIVTSITLVTNLLNVALSALNGGLA
ncbi:hypothetical protein HOJ01_03840 [bacterium]|jgi:hypothetical protein|nr:hypothetical protein [bacterium]MBT6293911.1 hypothetical protein [bacterium]